MTIHRLTIESNALTCLTAVGCIINLRISHKIISKTKNLNLNLCVFKILCLFITKANSYAHTKATTTTTMRECHLAFWHPQKPRQSINAASSHTIPLSLSLFTNPQLNINQWYQSRIVIFIRFFVYLIEGMNSKYLSSWINFN